MLFSFGENGKMNKIDFDKLVSGLSKDDLAIVSDDFINSLFNSIDTNKDKKLDRTEISIFEKKIKQLAGDDNSLSVEEAKLFKIGDKTLGEMENVWADRLDENGNALIHSKVDDLFSFLNSLVSKTEGVKRITEKRAVQTIEYTNGIQEIKGPNNSLVIKDASGKVIFDSEAKVKEENLTNVTDAEFYMINYLKEQIKTAKYIIETADDNTSITGSLVDWWCRCDWLGMDNNHPLDKMNEVIRDLENSLAALEQAAKKSPEEYQKVCKEKLGVDFNEAAVEEFMLQANEYELLSQQYVIYDIACNPGKYLGEHGHAAANQVASYRENAANFLLVCESMGYNDAEIQAIIDKAVVKFNNSPEAKKYPYEYAEIGSLQNPDNKYFMAQRKGGGYDVDWGPLTGYAFEILREQIEADLNKLYGTDNFENFYKEKTDNYNTKLKEVLGFSNVVDSATSASNEYQADVAKLNNTFMMITMVATLASGGLGILANCMKGVGLIARCTSALNACNNVIRITSGVNKYLSVVGMVAMTNPTGFVDQLFSKNGMTADAFATWGKGVLQNCAFMGAGMAASNFAMRFASWFKAAKLAKLVKKGGSSFDDLMNAVKSSPQKFPPDLVKSLNSISRTSTLLQISAETLMDCGFSTGLNYCLNGNTLTTYDALMSLAFAINGGFIEKTMREQNTQNAKINCIHKVLDDFKKLPVEEQNIKLKKYLDDNNMKISLEDFRKAFNDFNYDKKTIRNIVETGEANKIVTLATAIYGDNGCILQKELSVLSDDAKARYIQKALKDFNLSYNDAWLILDYMDAIAKNEKIVQNELLETVDISVKSTKKINSVSEEFNRLSEMEDSYLPERIQNLEELSVNKPETELVEIDFSEPIAAETGNIKKVLVEPGDNKIKTTTQLKEFETLVPNTSNTQLATSNRTLFNELENPSNPNKPLKVLTEEGDALAWEIAEQLRTNALGIEDNIVKHFIDAGLATEETLLHRSKGLQSLHDKIQSYIFENPDKSVADAVREVRDAVGVRTVNKSENVRNHPAVVELIEKGDYKSAIHKAVELESEYVLNSLKGVIDKMADGTAEFSIGRISNYMGEDGIPYFTEKQLFELQAYALDKGIQLPVVSRVTDATQRASATDIYNDKGTTVVRKSGYTALQINFVTKDGDIFEWQYRGDKLNDFGEGEHIPYDLRTGKDIIGKDIILTDLYKPIKDILTGVDSNNNKLMSDDLYKEYNAYLTAHYKYLRELELGFVEPGNPPKLPKGIDERLRADNLIILHDIGEELKSGKISIEDALTKYNQELVRNTAENITDISYKSNLDAIKGNANIDRYEALTRLGKKAPTNVDTELLVKTCMDSQGNIKNNLVALIEQYRAEGLEDKAIFNFISRFKDENGVISDDIFKNLNEFINVCSKNKKNNTDVLNLFSAITLKDSTSIISNASKKELVNLIINKKISTRELNFIQDITDFMSQKNLTGDSTFMDITHFYIELKNGNAQSTLLSKDFTQILNSITDKNGKISDKAMSLAITLSKSPFLKENYATFISSCKNPITGEIEEYTINLIGKLINDLNQSGYKNSAVTTTLLTQVSRATKNNQVVQINGKQVCMPIPDKNLTNAFFSLYDGLPKTSTEINTAQQVKKTSLVMNACKLQDGTISQQKLALAEKLLKFKYTPESISEVLIRGFDKYGKPQRNVDAFFKNYNNLSSTDKANLKQIELKLENGILRQTMIFNDGSIKVFDIDGRNVNSRNEYEISNKKVTQERSVISYKKIRDGVRDKSTKTISKNGVIVSETTIIYDKNGNRIGTEHITRGINGTVEVKFRDNDGNTTVMSKTEYDPEGNLTVNKEFPSLDGTITTQSFKETPDGSTESIYIIKDPDGNILLEETRSFTRISDTHFTSSFNGKTYDIQIDELKVLTVIDNNGNKVRFDLHALSNNQLKTFENILKQIPGHEFFNMAEVGLKSIDLTEKRNNAHYKLENNSIYMGIEHKTFSTFLHEFGHNKDWKLKINSDKALRFNDEIKKIYAEEQAAFVREFPSEQRDIISYFISLDNATSRTNQGIAETIAETNNILSTPYQDENLAFRKYYLQRYFPRTIAYIAKELNPNIYSQ